GRGEVGVAVGREAEVAERLRRVARLLHGAQQDRVDEPLLGATLRLLEHGGERPGRRTPLLHPQTQPEALAEARQLAHALRRRRAMSRRASASARSSGSTRAPRAARTPGSRSTSAWRTWV